MFNYIDGNNQGISNDGSVVCDNANGTAKKETSTEYCASDIAAKLEQQSGEKGSVCQ